MSEILKCICTKSYRNSHSRRIRKQDVDVSSIVAQWRRLVQTLRTASTSTYYSIFQSLLTRLPFLSAVYLKICVQYFLTFLLNNSQWASTSTYYSIAQSFAILICCEIFLDTFVKYFSIFLFNISQTASTSTYYSIFQPFAILMIRILSAVRYFSIYLFNIS